MIDVWFARPDTIHCAEPKETEASRSDQLSVELLIDPVGHVPLDNADDEIIDRVAAAQSLAGREITLITYDTTMSTRARHFGFKSSSSSTPDHPRLSQRSARVGKWGTAIASRNPADQLLGTALDGDMGVVEGEDVQGFILIITLSINPETGTSIEQARVHWPSR